MCVLLAISIVYLAVRLRQVHETLDRDRERHETRGAVERLIAWFTTMPNSVEFFEDMTYDRFVIRTREREGEEVKEYYITELGDEQLSGGFHFWGCGIDFEESGGGLLDLFHHFVRGYPNLQPLKAA